MENLNEFQPLPGEIPTSRFAASLGIFFNFAPAGWYDREAIAGRG